jgi:hypothetical protein
MAIFTFLAKLGLDTTDFQTGIKRAQSSASGLGKGISESLKRENDSIKGALAGMFTVSAAKSYFGELKNIVGEIKDMSELLEISTDEVQRLQKAAETSGQSFKVIVGAFQRIEQMKAQALTGDERANRIFGMLGINPESSSMDIMQRAVKSSGGSAKESAAAFELLGRKVGNLRLVVDELNQMGDVKTISEGDIQTIDDNVKKFEAAFREFMIAGAPIATALIQGLTALLNLFRADVKTVSALDVGFGKAIEMNAASFLGLKNEDGRKYSALPLPENRTKQATEDSTPLLMRIAKANEDLLQSFTTHVDQ